MSALDDVAVARNEAIRQAALLGLRAAAPIVQRALAARIGEHAGQQVALRRRYGVTFDTPIRGWGPEQEARLAAWAKRRDGVRWAETSGSTSRPKRLPYDAAALARIKRASWESAVQAGAAHGVDTPTLFAFAGMTQDASLSSLLLEERRGLVPALVMPSRLLWTPGAAPLVERFGATACRVFLLALSAPGFLYATNPSTLAVFVDKLEADWDEAAALARAFLQDADLPGARELLRRCAAPGWRRRCAVVAEARRTPPADAWLERLRCWVSWDGGYVAPFLERVRRALPAPRFQHVPMYSMSTETLETTTVWRGGRAHFLPLGPGVLYELLPEGAPDDQRLLVPTTDAEVGRTYSLVVSDARGLRRYQTEDLFLVADRVSRLPDLRFLRRRGLAYSFTGEKLTGEQVVAAFEALRPTLGPVQLALLPSAEGLPHYRLAIATPGTPDGSIDPAAAAASLDRLLQASNAEYATKRESARLGPVRGVVLAYDVLAEALQRVASGTTTGTAARGWDTQWKLLPLHTRRWESLELPG